MVWGVWWGLSIVMASNVVTGGWQLSRGWKAVMCLPYVPSWARHLQNILTTLPSSSYLECISVDRREWPSLEMSRDVIIFVDSWDHCRQSRDDDMCSGLSCLHSDLWMSRILESCNVPYVPGCAEYFQIIMYYLAQQQLFRVHNLWNLCNTLYSLSNVSH